MTDLRLKRLLILASNAGGNHKRFYSQYVKTGAMGYTGWVIGMAYLTEKGMKKLEDLMNQQELRELLEYKKDIFNV